MSGPQSVRGPYKRSAQTRASIIEAATEIFGSAGYRGATMKDVAERVGMTATGMSYYFSDKDTLLAAVLSDRDQRNPSPGIQDVRLFADLVQEIVRTNISAPRLTELQTVVSAEATSPDHPAHVYFRDRYRRFRADLAQLISREPEALSAPSVDPTILASIILGVLDGVQLQWLLDPDEVSMEETIHLFLSQLIPTTAEASLT